MKSQGSVRTGNSSYQRYRGPASSRPTCLRRENGRGGMGVPSSIHVFHKPYGHGRFDSKSRIRQALGSNSVWGKVRLGQPKTPPAGRRLRFFRENLKNSIFPPFGPFTPGGSSGRALAAAEEAARLAKAGGRQDPTRAPSTPTRAAKRNRDVPTKALRRRANALPTPPRRDNRYKKLGLAGL